MPLPGPSAVSLLTQEARNIESDAEEVQVSYEPLCLIGPATHLTKAGYGILIRA